MSVYKSCDDWFNFPAGLDYGVFVKEKIAKKLQDLLRRQNQEIKDFLIANKDDLLPKEWVLAFPYPRREQTTVYYSSQTETIEQHLKFFDKTHILQYIDNGVFICDKKWNEAFIEVREFYEKNVR